jgi:hypothetical protein
MSPFGIDDAQYDILRIDSAVWLCNVTPCAVDSLQDSDVAVPFSDLFLRLPRLNSLTFQGIGPAALTALCAALPLLREMQRLSVTRMISAASSCSPYGWADRG